MRVSLSSLGRFHFYSLATELAARGYLKEIFTGYPRNLVAASGVPAENIRSFPWLVAPRMALADRLRTPRTWVQYYDNMAQKTHDSWVARILANTDIFHGLSRYNLRSGQRAKMIGAKYICDVGSAHIIDQIEILEREQHKLKIYEHWVHPQAVLRELREYEQADAIFVMSTFALESFIRRGVPREKLRMIAPGVNLARFNPRRKQGSSIFRVLFVGHVGIQKGAHVLAEAFKHAAIPNSQLTLIGSINPQMRSYIESLEIPNVQLLGHVEHSDLARHYRNSSVFVLPSFQDGFGMVALEAMACGAPAIISRNAGASDLIRDGVNGFTFDAGNVAELSARLQQLASDPELTTELSLNAASITERTHSWSDYASRVVDEYRRILNDGRA